MPFPQSPRVVYQRNTLEEVICQLRFPTILRIDAENAATFQERVRNEYPLYVEADVVSGPPMPPEIAQLLRGGLPITKQFLSQDQVWKIGLTRDFLALSTSHYERWEVFRARLQFALDAFVETYRPSFLSRIGLRYRNLIHRPDVGLAGTAWRELVKPHVSAELASDMAGSVQEAAHAVLFKLDELGGRVRLRHGLEKREGLAEEAYVLDADFFTDSRTEVVDVLPRLGDFNREAARLFRWCITDTLHQRLEPRAIE